MVTIAWLLAVRLGNTYIGLLQTVSGNAELALGVSAVTLPSAQLVEDGLDLVMRISAPSSTSTIL